MHADVIDKNNQPEDDYNAVGVIDNDRNTILICPKLVLAPEFVSFGISCPFDDANIL